MGFLGLFTRHKPKIKVKSSKKDGFSGWVKCKKCEEMIHANELQENHNCCPNCDHHYRLSATERIELLADPDTFEEHNAELKPSDPLKFVDSEAYKERIARAEKRTGRNEAVLTGSCRVNGMECALGALDFGFMGGSMGSVVGERITLLIEYALEKKIPLVLVSSSGGARMQESVFSLMQMAKSSAALAKLHNASIPYISILANPTTGGVTASFASLGDIMIAEPEALIGFAGPRVVEQTIGQKLPETAQKSEFLLEKGMIDCIVKRSELKEKLSFFMEFLSKNQPLPSRTEKLETREKIDDLIALSQKEREKNAIEVGR
ncbi:MAG: Acetyl-coenzyme A carboxylase carboxyl transferase subunit beta [Chlamydiae bacterium]|nr:Acetyl-coenzyme A carboxylase carboxyl transferase subunit beta [Chlamydiota bacterium]